MTGDPLTFCPRCKRYVIRVLALSRVDNKTKICSKCGAEEGLIVARGRELDVDWIPQEEDKE